MKAMNMAAAEKFKKSLLPGLILSICIPLLSMAAAITEDFDSMKTISDFSNPAEKEKWVIINDGVMGGLSQSSMEIADDSTALFSGSVSLKNNGGFASTRTSSEDLELEKYSGLRLRVKGDGKKYQLRLRTDDNFDGVAFKHEFITEPDEWMEIDFPFEKFIASFRGRELPEIGSPDPAKVKQIGFLISGKQEGEFSLKIDWIAAY